MFVTFTILPLYKTLPAPEVIMIGIDSDELGVLIINPYHPGLFTVAVKKDLSPENLDVCGPW